MSLLSLGAVTVAGYQARTGDTDTAASAVSAVLLEAESLLEEELRRELALEERSEVMRIDRDGRMYPRAWPITTCATNVIQGRALLGGTPDTTQFVALIGSSVPPVATVTYTGGFDADTFPVTLRNVMYDMTRSLALLGAQQSVMLVGASSVSVGDVSIGLGGSGSMGGGGGLDAYSAGLDARVARYKNRFL